MICITWDFSVSRGHKLNPDLNGGEINSLLQLHDRYVRGCMKSVYNYENYIRRGKPRSTKAEDTLTSQGIGGNIKYSKPCYKKKCKDLERIRRNSSGK